MTPADEYASVRYIAEDVEACIDFYTRHLGFTVHAHPAPAFADVRRGRLRLLLSGPGSSGSMATPAGTGPGRNRIHLQVADLEAEVARVTDEGVEPLTEVVSGPGGRQVLLADPAGNLVELFEARAAG